MIGTRSGPYEITAPLGEGGMGFVYRATDSKLKREVAIKVLPEALADPHELSDHDGRAGDADGRHPRHRGLHEPREGARWSAAGLRRRQPRVHRRLWPGSAGRRAIPVHVQPAAGLGSSRLVAGRQAYAQLSPDGSLLAHASNEQVSFEVFVGTIPPSGAIWQISTGGGTMPRWRHDGREFYDRAVDDGQRFPVCSSRSTGQPPMTVVVNWPAAMGNAGAR